MSWIALTVMTVAFGCLIRWAPDAKAYPTYTAFRNELDANCAQCHGDYTAPYTSLSDGQTWGADLMTVHYRNMLSGDCSTCHFTGRYPVYLNKSAGGTDLAPISCIGCHGRIEDRSADNSRCVNPNSPNPPCGDGAGLRQHHWNANRTVATPNGPVTTRVCATCHRDADPANYKPVGENIPPPYYFTPDNAHPDKPTDACNPPPAYPEDFEGTLNALNNDGDYDVNGPLYDQFDPDCAPDLCAGVVCDDQNACTKDSCDPATGECVFDPSPAALCDDGNLCTVDTCDPGTGQCLHSEVICDDQIACTRDACNPTTGTCEYLPVPPVEAGPMKFQSNTSLEWIPAADASHWNSYRGSIPAGMLGSRSPNVYDHACFESADAAGDGGTISTDTAVPPLGSAFYYDVTGENPCGEGPLGSASSGAVRPNTLACPTPP